MPPDYLIRFVCPGCVSHKGGGEARVTTLNHERALREVNGENRPCQQPGCGRITIPQIAGWMISSNLTTGRR